MVDRHQLRFETPLIVLASAQEIQHAITALDAGADDIVSMMATVEELGARLRAVLRQRGRVTGSPVALTVAGRDGRSPPPRPVAAQPVTLTALEFKLLTLFLMHPDEPVNVSGSYRRCGATASAPTATVTVRAPREDRGEPRGDPMLIRTVWGVGYRFSPMP